MSFEAGTQEKLAESRILPMIKPQYASSSVNGYIKSDPPSNMWFATIRDNGPTHLEGPMALGGDRYGIIKQLKKLYFSRPEIERFIQLTSQSDGNVVYVAGRYCGSTVFNFTLTYPLKFLIPPPAPIQKPKNNPKPEPLPELVEEKKEEEKTEKKEPVFSFRPPPQNSGSEIPSASLIDSWPWTLATKK